MTPDPLSVALLERRILRYQCWALATEHPHVAATYYKRARAAHDALQRLTWWADA